MTICTLLQPAVDFLQQIINAAYIPFNLIGISAPPVATWFNPFLQIFGCTLT